MVCNIEYLGYSRGWLGGLGRAQGLEFRVLNLGPGFIWCYE